MWNVLPERTVKMMLVETDYRWVIYANEEDDTVIFEKELTEEALLKLLGHKKEINETL